MAQRAGKRGVNALGAGRAKVGVVVDAVQSRGLPAGQSAERDEFVPAAEGVRQMNLTLAISTQVRLVVLAKDDCGLSAAHVTVGHGNECECAYALLRKI